MRSSDAAVSASAFPGVSTLTDRQRDRADYIRELTQELRKMAEQADLPLLAYLLTMAELECESILDRHMALPVARGNIRLP